MLHLPERVVYSHHLVKKLQPEFQGRLKRIIDLVMTEHLVTYVMAALGDSEALQPRRDLNEQDQDVYYHWETLWHEYGRFPHDTTREPGYNEARAMILGMLSSRSMARFEVLERKWLSEKHPQFPNPVLKDMLIDCLTDPVGNLRADLTVEEKGLLADIYRYHSEAAFRQHFFPPISAASQERLQTYQENNLTQEVDRQLLGALASPEGKVHQDLTTTELLIFELIYARRLATSNKIPADISTGFESDFRDVIDDASEANDQPDVSLFEAILYKLHIMGSAPGKALE